MVHACADRRTHHATHLSAHQRREARRKNGGREWDPRAMMRGAPDLLPLPPPLRTPLTRVVLWLCRCVLHSCRTASPATLAPSRRVLRHRSGPEDLVGTDRALPRHSTNKMRSALGARSPTLLFVLLAFVLAAWNPLCVSGFSWLVSQWSGACVTLAVSQSYSWPSGAGAGGPREVFAACQYVGVLTIFPLVSVGLLMTMTQCPLVDQTRSAMVVENGTMFVSCGTNGVLGFDVATRETTTIINAIEASQGVMDLAFDTVRQRMYAFSRDGLFSVGVTNGQRNGDPLVRHLDTTSCPSKHHLAIYNRTIYATCGGGLWSVWQVNLDTGAPAGLLKNDDCPNAGSIFVNARGVFVLCTRLSDSKVIIQRYSFAGSLQFTWGDVNGQYLTSVWASSTDDFVLGGSRGMGVMSYLNGAPPQYMVVPTGCTMVADMVVLQSGSGAQMQLELLVGCSNTPVIWSFPEMQGLRLLADSCGGSQMVVANPISGVTSEHIVAIVL